jgi:hypothetical protein
MLTKTKKNFIINSVSTNLPVYFFLVPGTTFIFSKKAVEGNEQFLNNNKYIKIEN